MPPPWLGVPPGSSQPVDATADETLRSLVASHELERRQIARDLHDVVGQSLTAVRLHLELVRRHPSRATAVATEAGEAIELVDAALRQVRDLAFDIRPAILDDLGLVPACRAWVARQARIGGYAAEFRTEDEIRGSSLEVEAACFRTLQEALTNVSRHAAATRVEVELVAIRDELVLTVRDNGVGFEPGRMVDAPDRTSLGLLGTWERITLAGGTLTIDSAPGRGTALRAMFPLCPEPAEAPGRG